MFSKYAKAIVAIVVSALAALIAALGVGSDATFSSIDGKHWLVAALFVLGSGGVTALVSNIPGVAAGIAKAIVAFLSAGFASLVIALNDNHITQAEWLIAASAAVVAAAGVYEKVNGPTA